MNDKASYTRRDFLRTLTSAAAALAVGGPAGWIRAEESSSYPDIVVIMADDMGYGDLGCYNKDSKIPTPNMDRIAAEGIRFTDAHAPSAVCTPTRYGLLTGRYCWRSRLKRGVLGGYSPLLIDTNRLTLASLLKRRGYATACIGKWHLGLGNRSRTDFSKPLVPGPNQLGFDYFFGISASLDMPPYCYIENDRPTQLPSQTIGPGDPRKDGWWRKGAIAPDFKHIEVLPKLTEKATQFIRDHHRKSPKQPMFVYFALPAPHCPIAPAPFVRGRSRAGGYGDYVVEVDWTVGEVLKALEQTGRAHNTLIIVTSDNGSPARTKIKRQPYSLIELFDHYPNGPWRGIKADIWDGGHREPFIARWPARIPAGTVSDQLICLTDLMATFAAIVGEKLPPDAGEDSFNILPALLGRKLQEPIRSAIVHHSGSGMFAIRQGHWKLILGRGSGGFTKPSRIKPAPGEPQGQLYNLKDDPAEKHNLWAERPDIVRSLTELLQKYQQQGYSRPM